MKIVGFLLLSLVAAWLVGDLIYSRIVAYRIGQWEATIERDASGVQKGFGEYTIGDGDTALLLVHGINDSPLAYRKMAPVLAQQGFTCRVMRLPGFGLPIDQFSRATHQQWIDQVDAEIKQLRAEHPRVGVIAHSLGGAVTIAYLLKHPQAADAVVLLAPAVEVSNQRSPLLSTRAWHEIGKMTLWFTRVTQTPFENDTHDPSERDYPGRTIFTPRRIFDETFWLIDHNRGRAGEFQTPLMMVLSKDDQIVDWRAAEQFYEQANASNKRIRFMQDAGHVIPVDYGWQELTHEIAEFVRP